MLELPRVADANNETRVKELKMRMSSTKKLKLDDRLEAHKVDIQPTKAGPQELELAGRSELLKVDV